EVASGGVLAFCSRSDAETVCPTTEVLGNPGLAMTKANALAGTVSAGLIRSTRTRRISRPTGLCGVIRSPVLPACLEETRDASSRTAKARASGPGLRVETV